jgi:starch synthase
LISSEVESLARTGGLGDVVEALGVHLARSGLDVLIVTPLYGVTKLPACATRWDRTVSVPIAGAPREVGIAEAQLEHRGDGRLRVCLLDDPPLFARAGLYGDHHGAFGDNELRFAVLSRGALEVSRAVWGELESGGGPDVIHAHDWHAALAIVYARLTMGEAWRKRGAVYTIHNLAYQGVFGPEVLDALGVPREAFHMDLLEQDGNVNFMKGGIGLADRVTTVSPTYAREIRTPEGGFGLDGYLRHHAAKIVGILNGIDVHRFDPATDATLAARYDALSFVTGKRACKEALLRELGLDEPGATEQPLFSVVSRLSWQKGIDLLVTLTPELVARGARVVLVGQGEGHLEQGLRDVAARHPGRVASRITFDPDLARRIYAGSDFFFVPSRFEPCGLTQMYAMRYGAIPIVTAVGGLRDTVAPIDRAAGRGTGIVAARASLDELRGACDEALRDWAEPTSFRSAVQRAMARDSSWERSAAEYVELYRELVAQPR